MRKELFAKGGKKLDCYSIKNERRVNESDWVARNGIHKQNKAPTNDVFAGALFNSEEDFVPHLFRRLD